MARGDSSENRPQIRDIVGEGGVGARAHDLIQASHDTMPHELRRAHQLPHYTRLRQQRIREHGEENAGMKPAPALEPGDVAKAAGLDAEQVADAQVHGRNLDDAWVVYVAYDALGAPFHGAYPLNEHGHGKAKSHVSVAESFAESEIGKRLIEERERGADEERKPSRSRAASGSEDSEGADSGA